TQSLLVATIFLFIALSCVELTRPPRPYLAIALATVFAGYLALPYLSFRPVTRALAMIAWCAWLLLRDRRMDERSSGIWLVPILTAVLINVHLFALFIPMWTGALLAGAIWERFRIAHWSERTDYTRRIKRYCALFACCCFACLATPMLGGVMSTLSHYGQHDPMVAAKVIAELRPFYDGPMWPITTAVLLAAIGLMIWKRSDFRLAEWAMLAIGLGGLFWMGRLAPLFVLIAAPMLAAALPTLKARLLARPIVWSLLCATIGLGVVKIVDAFPSRETPLAVWLNRHGPETPGYPSGAAAFVANRIPATTGRIINDFNWGGYLAWELGSRYQVFMDARTQLYTPEFWNDTCLGNQQAVESSIRAITADAAIVPLKSPKLAVALKALGWKQVYHDDRAQVFIPPDSPVVDMLADTKE
ncbi:MAG: hypothetical protein H7Z14_07565, partial [Anaerolineae bacterium]|nr:hypothetical protein [Phycisphaerae bacterium]